jgi:hypothetical protein
VQTGSYAADEPYPLVIAAPTDRDAPLLTIETNARSVRSEQYVLTWHALATASPSNVQPHVTAILPLWMIQQIEVTASNRSGPGTGDLRLTIGGERYTGPTIRVLKAVVHPHWAKAIIWRQRALATTM